MGSVFAFSQGGCAGRSLGLPRGVFCAPEGSGFWGSFFVVPFVRELCGRGPKAAGRVAAFFVASLAFQKLRSFCSFGGVARSLVLVLRCFSCVQPKEEAEASNSHPGPFGARFYKVLEGPCFLVANGGYAGIETSFLSFPSFFSPLTATQTGTGVVGLYPRRRHPSSRFHFLLQSCRSGVGFGQPKPPKPCSQQGVCVPLCFFSPLAPAPSRRKATRPHASALGHRRVGGLCFFFSFVHLVFGCFGFELKSE